MSTMQETEAAIRAQVFDNITSIDPFLEIEWPNEPFKMPADGKTFATVNILFTAREPLEIGGNVDDVTGLVIVQIRSPVGSSTQEHNAVVQDFVNALNQKKLNVDVRTLSAEVQTIGRLEGRWQSNVECDFESADGG